MSDYRREWGQDHDWPLTPARSVRLTPDSVLDALIGDHEPAFIPANQGVFMYWEKGMPVGTWAKGEPSG